jgi:hypothetical protein
MEEPPIYRCSVTWDTRIIQLQECITSDTLWRSGDKCHLFWEVVLENPYMEVEAPKRLMAYQYFEPTVISIKFVTVEKKENGKISTPFRVKPPLDVDIRIDKSVKEIIVDGVVYHVPTFIGVKPAIQL